MDASNAHDRPVPGAPDTTEDTADGQRALRLHGRIAAIAFVLCAFVAVVFVRLESIPAAAVFTALAVGCLAVLAWAIVRKRRGAKRS